MKKYIILIPLYNDWESLLKLLENIDIEISNYDSEISVLIVNDASTEERVIESLKKLSKNLTVILVSHRISALKNCDKIYCFDNGKIVDQGSFDKFKMQN